MAGLREKLAKRKGIGKPIDLKRPIVKNKDRSFSTERSITVDLDDAVVNIPTIVGGKQLSNEAAIAHAKKTKKNLGVFKTRKEAVSAAKKRSKTIGKLRSKEAGVK